MNTVAQFRLWRTARIVIGTVLFTLVGACDSDDATSPVSNSPTVGAEGGRIDLGGGVVITVPSGVLTSPLTFSVRSSESHPGVTDPNRVGAIHDFGPSGTTFGFPVGISVPLPAGFSGDASNLVLVGLDASGDPVALEQSLAGGGQVFAYARRLSAVWISNSRNVPVRLEANPGDMLLRGGDRVVLRVAGFNLEGAGIAVGSVGFSSSDPSIVTVSAAGEVVARGFGTTTIRATAGGVSVDVPVSALVGELASIRIEPSGAVVPRRSEQQFTAFGRDAAGNEVPLVGGVRWRSLDPVIALVDASGRMQTRLGFGTFAVEAEARGIRATAPVTVAAPIPSVLEVTTPASRLPVTETLQLATRTFDEFGQSMASPPGVTWLARDPAKVDVAGDGTITGRNVGQVWMVASSPAGTDSVQVRVVAGPAVTLSIAAEAFELAPGDIVDLEIEAFDAFGNRVEDGFEFAARPTGVVRGFTDGRLQALGSVGSTTVVVSQGTADPDSVQVEVGLPITAGLESWYDFSGDARDRSGKGWNGTPRNGASLTRDRFGMPDAAYQVRWGQDIQVEGSEANNLYPITISVWMRLDNVGFWETGNVFGKYESNAWNGYHIKIEGFYQDGRWMANVNPWFIRDGASNVMGDYFGNPPLSWPVELNQWVHVAFRVDDEGGALFVDGTKRRTMPWRGTPGPSSSSFLWHIGGHYGNPGGWMEGALDDVGVWDRSLTDDEIRYLSSIR